MSEIANRSACHRGERVAMAGDGINDAPAPAQAEVGSAMGTVDLIRFGGRVDYVDLVSSSFVEESLQVLGGLRISIWRSFVAAGERPAAI